MMTELKDRMTRTEETLSQSLKADQNAKMLELVEHIDIQVKAQAQNVHTASHMSLATQNEDNFNIGPVKV